MRDLAEAVIMADELNRKEGDVAMPGLPREFSEELM
jgi:hypothetical protein